MTPAAALAILAAGLAAGTLNTIVGSGSLITFPTLLALGYPPVVANVSNTLGLVTGSISGVVGYRRELMKDGIFELPLNLKRSHMSYAHTDEDVDRLLEATEAAVGRFLSQRT